MVIIGYCGEQKAISVKVLFRLQQEQRLTQVTETTVGCRPEATTWSVFIPTAGRTITTVQSLNCLSLETCWKDMLLSYWYYSKMCLWTCCKDGKSITQICNGLVVHYKSSFLAYYIKILSFLVLDKHKTIFPDTCDK